MWTKIWHVAGRLVELEEPGDFVVHDFMGQSVICAKQEDGSIRAFYNVCQHRAATGEEAHRLKTFTVATTVGSGASRCFEVGAGSRELFAR